MAGRTCPVWMARVDRVERSKNWNTGRPTEPNNTRAGILSYRKIPIIYNTVISPGLIFVQKAVLLGLFSEGLVIGRNFAFYNGSGLTIKQLALTVHGLIFGRAYYRKDFCV